MTEPSTEALFVRYRETGDPQALAAVFDHVAPQLLLVAAHLAGGGLAEDLVQATFLDAIRQRERWDASRRLAPWLVGLLGNHVREARRQRRRVPDPQRFEMRESERPDDAAAANECIEAVRAAVERLPRHYRLVLSLRLVHGLDQQQIANSLGVPLGTVKVRLHRGVALLRRALPAGLASAVAVLLSPGRGLAAVREVVLGHAGVAAGAATATGIGILIGGLVMKQVVIAVVVVVAVIGTWFAVDAARAVPVPVEVASGAAAAPVATRDSAPAAPASPSAIAPSVPAKETTASREAAPSTGGLALRVIWAADGTPAPGIDVKVSLRDGTRAAATRRSDAAGRLQFDGLEQGTYSLQVSNTRKVSPPDRTIVAGQVHACDLVLDGDVRLRVLVVDGEATPRAGAAVWSEDPSLESDPPVRCLGHTDAAGLLAYRGLPVTSVWARLPPLQPSACAELPQLQQRELPREPIDVRLVLGPPGCTVVGTVVDPNGRPVASASVLVASDEETEPAARHIALQLTTDAQGRFSCDEVPAGERAIVADAAGFAPALARIVASPTEPVTITLVLRIGATLSGRITNAAGQPIAGVIVVTSRRPSVPGFQWPWGDQRLVRTDAEGHYRIAAILAGSTRASVQMKPPAVRQFEFDDGQQVTWDVAKEPDRSLVGVVTDADGKPLVGWRVEALGGARVGFLREHSVKTDAAGRFRIAGLEDSTYRLFVFAPVPPGQDADGIAGMVPRAVLNNARPSPTELAVRIDDAAMSSSWIEGSIAMPEGVRASTRLSLYAKVLQGGKFDMPQELLEPGVTTFRLGPLPPGEYDLYCEIEGRGRLLQRGLRLDAGATLQLPPFAANDQRPLQIVLRHADGRPATGAAVVGLARCRETAPGRYESQPIAAGAYDVTVHGPDFAPMAFHVDFVVGVPPFERVVPTGTTVQLCIKPPTARERWVASLAILLRDGNGAEVLGERIEVDSVQDFVWPIGLVPGSYTVKVDTLGDGTATATFQVGAAPQRIDLPLAK